MPVGRVVLDAALGQLAELRRRAVRLPGGVAVNVASGQLARVPGRGRARRPGPARHPGGELALEITEATALPDAGLPRRLAHLGAAAVALAPAA